uniref:Putative secreted protein n=1 Tax=Anopheles marajoara TaxID=58244 RepID=A0A2M4C9U6_9DIPT
MNFRFFSFIHAHFIPLFWAADATECEARMLFAELIGSRSARCHVTIIKLMIANGGIRTWLVFWQARSTEHRTATRFAHLRSFTWSVDDSLCS